MDFKLPHCLKYPAIQHTCMYHSGCCNCIDVHCLLYHKHDRTTLLSSGYSPDMPYGTDRPYPIRILTLFEMIRPYHVVIRISGNLWGENCKSVTTFSPAKLPDRYDRSAFSSVIDWSKYIFQNSAGQSIVPNRGWRFPIRPYGDRSRTRSRLIQVCIPSNKS